MSSPCSLITHRILMISELLQKFWFQHFYHPMMGPPQDYQFQEERQPQRHL